MRDIFNELWYDPELPTELIDPSTLQENIKWDLDNEADRASIIKMYRTGESLNSIAAITNVSASAIKNMFEEYGVRVRGIKEARKKYYNN